MADMETPIVAVKPEDWSPSDWEQWFKKTVLHYNAKLHLTPPGWDDKIPLTDKGSKGEMGYITTFISRAAKIVRSSDFVFKKMFPLIRPMIATMQRYEEIFRTARDSAYKIAEDFRTTGSLRQADIGRFVVAGNEADQVVNKCKTDIEILQCTLQEGWMTKLIG